MRASPADPTAPLELSYFGPDARALGPEDFAARHGRAFLLLRGALDPSRKPTSPQKTMIIRDGSAPPPPRSEIEKARDSDAAGRGLGQLLVYPVKQTGRTPFPRVVTVGRTRNNDIVLPDISISKFHAFFKDEGGLFALSDGESRNGTFVDGDRVSSAKQGRPTPLKSGTLLKFGGLEFRFLDAADLIMVVRQFA
jgi:pSer/pThr/pTyr-binding forkhead associated (FHA) protein